MIQAATPLSTPSALFWRSLPVLIGSGLCEYLILLWVLHKRTRSPRRIGLRVLACAACLYSQVLMLSVTRHCLLTLAVWTVFICLDEVLEDYEERGAGSGSLQARHFLRSGSEETLWAALTGLKKGLFYSCRFCLFLEIDKLIFRDGMLTYIMQDHFPDFPDVPLQAVCLVLYLVFLAFGARMIRRSGEVLSFDQLTYVQTAGMLLPLALYIALRLFQFTYLERGGDAWRQMSTLLLFTSVCAEIVVLYTTRSAAYRMERQEMLHHQMLLERHLQQYRSGKEAIEMVNRRYHDLKYFITGASIQDAAGDSADTGQQTDAADTQAAAGGTLRATDKAASNTGPSARTLSEFAAQLEDSISPYERIQQTGSEVLDVLLYQYVEQCQTRQIRLLHYIDGRGLEFISTMDLCALFGNAMDNALEAAVQVEEPERREIQVKIGPSGPGIMMRFRNTCRGSRDISKKGAVSSTAAGTAGTDAAPDTAADTGTDAAGGVPVTQTVTEGAAEAGRKAAAAASAGQPLPRTTKTAAPGGQNITAHGYGLKNIAAIAERYGGSMSLEPSDGEFSLYILIPKP